MSHRHITSNHLPGLEPINSDHNVQKYRFNDFKLSFGYHLPLFGRPRKSSGLKQFSQCYVKFRALILIEQGENQFIYSSPLKISR